MIDRRLVEYFDWWMLSLIMMAAGIGLVALYSAVNAGIGDHQTGLFAKQMAWYGIGAAFMVAAFSFNYKSYEQFGHLFYALCTGLLVLVLVVGKIVGGSKRWLDLGAVSIQPSEIIKLAVIIMLARYYARIVRTDGLQLRELLTPALITVIPFLLIVRQPDLGTALVLALIAGAMTLYVKIERRTLIGLIGSGALAVPLVWSLLKGYQKQRILTFLNPDRDPLGAGYHIIQSKIAIGSGMLTGKGFLKGTQNSLDFLPEQHTDFIFSVLAEEWGLVGAVFVLMVFFLLIIRGLQIAHHSRDPFGTIMAVGVTTMIAWQVFINIGMVMGLMPVVGVTLPFVSYGGSSVITMMAGAGLLLNVSMRRFMFEK
ncbi:MAG: rod shape-determining protein RodA [Desulfatitalea sp.]|nr:rod shape-determining protein RodA [Desulfatitalea sp.]NNK01071.1 rod shape-determining protein RodA [Desulfatitalea sp.]